MDISEELLKKFTEARGIAGYEDEVRTVFKARMKGMGQLSFDGLGSVICEKKGSADNPRIMIAAHMDEPGFVVRQITPAGFLNLALVGGWRTCVLPAQRFTIRTRTGDVPGVMASEPPHAASPEERIKAPALDKLFVDVGACSEQEVLEYGIRVGDPVIPTAPFEPMHTKGTFMGKALDNRGACALLIDILAHFQSHSHPNTLIGAATSSEEVFDIERGAMTCAHLIKPDAAIILECGGADDTPGTELPSVRLGKGPVLMTADISMMANARLKNLVMDTAEQAGIPLQLTVAMKGRTDGGPIHLHEGGIPAVVIAIPARYIHTHSGILKRSDYDLTLKLVTLLVSRLDAVTVKGFTQW